MKKFILLLILAATPVQPQASEQCNVAVLVGENKSLEVTVPCMDRDQVREILITFLSRDNNSAKTRLHALLKQSGELTLTMTTKHRSNENSNSTH